MPVRFTQLGSWPGEDYAAACRTALAETPDPSHVPELPARGAPAAMIGRTTALLTDLAVDLQPAGWRLASGDGIDHRRAVAILRDDLDRFEEAADGFSGQVTISVAGPWTMAASVELPRGDKVLADPGARRDLAQSLAAGSVDLIGELQRRMPDVAWRVQLDEPSLPAVIAGAVPTASGYDRHRAVPEPDAAVVIDEFIQTLDATPVILHSCGPVFPWLAATQADAVAVDAGRLRHHDIDRIAHWLESGKELQLGVAATDVPDQLPSVEAISARTVALLRPLELGEVATERLVLVPACGLARWSVAGATELLRRLGEATEAVAEQLLR